MTETIDSRADAKATAWANEARRGPTSAQWAVAAAVTLLVGMLLKAWPLATVGALHHLLYAVFAWTGVQRLALVGAAGLSRGSKPPVPADTALPSYSLIVPLHDEAPMVAGLFEAFERVNYPRLKLQVIFALEGDDAATRAAVRHCAARSSLRVEVALSPPSGPRTKPKACNAALRLATGQLVTVFDAEDQPDPGQLREAAARFAADPTRRLACLQAPLRILPGRRWLQRQFAMEYAALFDVTLPGLAALGLPFPLGGTSNHFRRDVLVEAGGWDAWNVTEDADLGFRLAAAGWSLGVLTLPTWEPAPDTLEIWTRQRSRWIKGHMQTWGVHTRHLGAGGWRRALALQATLGLSLISSVMHGALACGVGACLLIAISGVQAPGVRIEDWALLAGGWASATVAVVVGLARSGRSASVADLASALAYWPLQSLAAIFALWELTVRPFHWSKTPHQPVAAIDA